MIIKKNYACYSTSGKKADGTNIPSVPAQSGKITSTLPQPNLIVTKTPANDVNIAVGDAINFTIIVNNTGTGTAYNITIDESNMPNFLNYTFTYDNCTNNNLTAGNTAS